MDAKEERWYTVRMNIHTQKEEHEPPCDITCAQPGDGIEISAIQKAAWLAAYPDAAVGLTTEDVEAVGIGSPEKLAKWEKSLEEQGEAKHIWVVREEGVMIGYAVAEKTPDMHELRAIYVLPSHHGKNIGGRLMKCALEWLGDEREVVVWVFTHNKRAIAFYRKCGFVENGNTSTWDVNGKPIPDLQMIRKIGGGKSAT